MCRKPKLTLGLILTCLQCQHRGGVGRGVVIRARKEKGKEKEYQQIPLTLIEKYHVRKKSLPHKAHVSICETTSTCVSEWINFSVCSYNHLLVDEMISTSSSQSWADTCSAILDFLLRSRDDAIERFLPPPLRLPLHGSSKHTPHGTALW